MPSYLAGPCALWRHWTTVKHSRVDRIARNQRKTVSRVRMDVVGWRERQWQKLLKARRHLLIESAQRRANPSVVRHQCHTIHQTRLAEHAQGAGVSIRAEL